MTPPDHYRVYKDIHGHARRWKIERLHADGSRTTIGDYPTENKAFTTARLLAGHAERVNVERG